MIPASLPPRLRVAALLLALALPAPGATVPAPAGPRPAAAAPDATSPPAAALSASELVVLSTTDVKGRTSPCGCHTPRGGLARRAALADSLRSAGANLLVVDTGGYFPEEAGYESAAAFLMDAMRSLGTVAAGVGESDLRFGRAFLLAQVARTKLPVTCANLLDRATGRPMVRPWILQPAGRAKVGFFALITDHGDLGPSADSLRVADPLETAQATVAALRARGATVIVLLSELGKVGTEEVANVIEGIDLVIAGRGVPLLPRARRIGGALVVFGGEQSHYAAVSRLPLDAAGRAGGSDAELVDLGPTQREDPGVFASVKRFEDALNDALRRRERELALHSVAGGDDDDDEPRDHYVGAEVCGRCHPAELAQWRTTPHARAWATLVNERAESRADCQRCHVVGFGEPGGFRVDADAPRLANVQCESCHGMGTRHDASRPAAPLTEATCRQCHDETSSPAFAFATFRPHVLHRPPAVLPPLPPRAKSGMH